MRSRKELAAGVGGGAREAHRRRWKEEEERRSRGEDGAHSGWRASH
jgi:hypothetical protein